MAVMTMCQKMSSVLCFVFCLMGMLHLCQTLTCTPSTSNTCTKSVYVTGNCVSGHCECVNGSVPDEYGCHKPYKPTVSAEFFSGGVKIGVEDWNGESSEGVVAFHCNKILGRTINWYVNGSEVSNSTAVLQRLMKPGKWLVQCSVMGDGSQVGTKSDALVVNVKEKGEHFTVKPLVSGVPNVAPVGSVFKIYCTRIPSFNRTFVFNIDEKQVIEKRPQTYLNMTADMFNKTVSCAVEPDSGETGVTSGVVPTPEVSAVDIPDVYIKQKQIFNDTSIPIFLRCYFNESFEPEDVVFTWVGPNGTIRNETNQYYYKSSPTRNDAGQYSCKAFYGNMTKVSPSIEVKLDEYGTNYVVSIPERPLIGGHISLICKTRGFNVPKPFYMWIDTPDHRDRAVDKNNPYLTDSVIQVNNIKTNDFNQDFECSSFFPLAPPSEKIHIPVPIPMSNVVQPSVRGDSNLSNVYTFHCESEYNTPGTIFVWYINDVQKASGSGNTFKFTQFDSSPSKVQCRLSFKNKNSSFSQNCTIPGKGHNLKPMIEVTDSPKSFIAGASYELKCSCVELDYATYSWKKGELNLNMNFSSIRLKDIGSEDNGNYTCAVTAGGQTVESKPLEIVALGEIEAPVVKIVASPPFDSYLDIILPDPGKTYYLMCFSPAHIKAAKYSWTNMVSKTNIIDLLTPDRILRIFNASFLDRGDHSCNITIGNKTKMSNAIEIGFPLIKSPTIYVEAFPTSYIIGGDYTIVCDTWLSIVKLEPGETLEFFWQIGDSAIKNKGHTLNLDNIQNKDDGKYTCGFVFRNKTMVSKSDVDIKVTSEGKYCNSNSNCTGTGFTGDCIGKQCNCAWGYKVEGKKCVSSNAVRFGYETLLFTSLIFWLISLARC